MSSEQTGEKKPGPIGRLLRPIRGSLIIAAVMAAIGTAFTLVPLAGIAHIAVIVLDNREAGALPSPSGLGNDVFWCLLSLFFGLAIVTGAEVLAHLADNRLTHHLRITAARRLARVPLGWFSNRASGEVKQAMQDDIGTLHDLTAHFFTTLGRTLGAMLISVIYMFVMDWRMAIVSIIPFVLFFIIFGAAQKAAAPHMGEFVKGLGRINNAVAEFVNGIPVIKTFSGSGKAHSSYREAISSFTQLFTRAMSPVVKTVALANAIVAPVTVLGVVLVFGTLFVALGWLTPVNVLPFALIAPGISAPLLLMGFITHGLRNATGAAERIQALLDTPLLTQTERPTSPQDTEIRFERVGYGYHDENRVLSDINLSLKPGSVTAIVGASGAGKSTLARLLLRFFDPCEGRITLGGVDLRQLDSATLYRHIGFVLQDVQLIHASLRDNIALGRPNASMQEIEAAARAANIHEHILGLPRGYDAVFGEDAQLSGGEQQRISIARAVLLNPPILVLDEATAAADAENECLIQEALSAFAKERTLLVIAHRLDTIMYADRIVVLEEGQIREQGSHSELLAGKGRYAKLWAAGGYENTLNQEG
ncbi:ABC transporter ATP-binding protein/permease [Serratia nevei]|uniref:ABC transporter ATP-binding protein n=1 Tax=Serratia nevei TaxID=2703794 RepID=UPI0020A0E080|nr:ABC transporter ATP-binding protein [Serratia nevei]MCP1107240.1 ABC transporter ATP-binding protein/permease [Serratia nevei]